VVGAALGVAVGFEEMSGPWVWGVSDCCASACNVFGRLWGIDPMSDYRGAYDSVRDAMRLFAGFGGFRQLIETAASAAGLSQSDARPGAIGVTHTGVYGGTLLICIDSGCWAGRTWDGFTTLDAAQQAWCVDAN